jgi:hypothetical protein
MTSRGSTIWELLQECVRSLSEPFRASEIIGWFRRHHPEVNEASIRTHIQGATSNVSLESRGAFARRTPLRTRMDHGLYARYRGEAAVGECRVQWVGSAARPPHETPSDPDWYTEAKIQSLVVSHLVSEGWSITSVADTATRARGIDVVARRGDQMIGVEVKGYPTRDYEDPARKGERKPSHPSAQAATYFAQAVLSAMRLRTSRPELLNVSAVPDFPRYRTLAEETRSSLIACGIDVWFVADDGSIDKPLGHQP